MRGVTGAARIASLHHLAVLSCTASVRALYGRLGIFDSIECESTGSPSLSLSRLACGISGDRALSGPAECANIVDAQTERHRVSVRSDDLARVVFFSSRAVRVSFY